MPWYRSHTPPNPCHSCSTELAPNRTACLHAISPPAFYMPNKGEDQAGWQGKASTTREVISEMTLEFLQCCCLLRCTILVILSITAATNTITKYQTVWRDIVSFWVLHMYHSDFLALKYSCFERNVTYNTVLF